MPLFRELGPGDTLRIGDTVIVAERKTGQRTRLRIDTPHRIQHHKAGTAPAAPSAPSGASDATPRPTLFRPATQAG